MHYAKRDSNRSSIRSANSNRSANGSAGSLYSYSPSNTEENENSDESPRNPKRKRSDMSMEMTRRTVSFAHLDEVLEPSGEISHSEISRSKSRKKRRKKPKRVSSTLHRITEELSLQSNTSINSAVSAQSASVINEDDPPSVPGILRNPFRQTVRRFSQNDPRVRHVKKKKKKKKKKKADPTTEETTYTESTLPMSTTSMGASSSIATSSQFTISTGLPRGLISPHILSASPPSNVSPILRNPSPNPSELTVSIDGFAEEISGASSSGRLHVGRLPFPDMRDTQISANVTLKSSTQRTKASLAPQDSKTRKDKSRAAVEKWSINDVGNWIGSLGEAYVKYQKLFVSSGVHGKLLTKMETIDFQDMGIQNNFHIKKILMELESLRKAARRSAMKKQKKKMAKNFKKDTSNTGTATRSSTGRNSKPKDSKYRNRNVHCNNYMGNQMDTDLPSSLTKRQYKNVKKHGIYE